MEMGWRSGEEARLQIDFEGRAKGLSTQIRHGVRAKEESKMTPVFWAQAVGRMGLPCDGNKTMGRTTFMQQPKGISRSNINTSHGNVHR